MVGDQLKVQPAEHRPADAVDGQLAVHGPRRVTEQADHERRPVGTPALAQRGTLGGIDRVSAHTRRQERHERGIGSGSEEPASRPLGQRQQRHAVGREPSGVRGAWSRPVPDHAQHGSPAGQLSRGECGGRRPSVQQVIPPARVLEPPQQRLERAACRHRVVERSAQPYARPQPAAARAVDVRGVAEHEHVVACFGHARDRLRRHAHGAGSAPRVHRGDQMQDSHCEFSLLPSSSGTCR